MNHLMEKIIGACSVLALGILVSPADWRIYIFVPVFSLFALLVFFLYDRLSLSWRLHWPSWFYAGVSVFFLCVPFVQHWENRHALSVVFQALHLPARPTLLALALILGLLALISIAVLMHTTASFLRKRFGTSIWGERLLRALSTLLILLLALLMLQSSCSLTPGKLLAAPKICLANLLLLFTLFALLAMTLGSWRRASLVFSVLVALWSIANFYTIQFHGSPLYFSELVNARTAAAVALEYRYRLSVEIAEVLLLLASAILFIRHTPMMWNNTRFSPALLGARAGLVALAILASWGMASTVVGSIAGWMPWSQGIEIHGFPVMMLHDVLEKRHPFMRPEGYDAQTLPLCPESDEAEVTGRRPDLILILNETLCDLGVYTDPEPDAEPLRGLYDIEGLRSGYAIVPKVGGGTNDSEFELLMSKPSYIVKGNSPFTFLWEYQFGRSAVQHLNSLGYSTLGMHCEVAENYNRNNAYPQLGFSKIVLGHDGFSQFEANGNRDWTDRGNYLDLIAQYEQLPSDAPRFAFLLTYQNHGGYEKNSDSLDTVHTRRDFGALTDDVNEFLSSIRLSAEAFSELTEYFSRSEREVVICMVGDHAPPFIQSLPPSGSWSEEEISIRQRTVPYFVWANFELAEQSGMETVSMTDLFPLMLKQAGLPLTPYYRYILQLAEAVPVRTSTGLYRDATGQIGHFEEQSPYYELINGYYCLAYNSLQKEPEYRAELFELPAAEPGSS